MLLEQRGVCHGVIVDEQDNLALGGADTRVSRSGEAGVVLVEVLQLPVVLQAGHHLPRTIATAVVDENDLEVLGGEVHLD